MLPRNGTPDSAASFLPPPVVGGKILDSFCNSEREGEREGGRERERERDFKLQSDRVPLCVVHSYVHTDECGNHLTLGTHKSTHILHHSQNREPNLPTETDLFANVQQSNFLHSSEPYTALNRTRNTQFGAHLWHSYKCCR